MSNYYFKVPASKSLKLKTSISMKLPLINNGALGEITIQNKNKTGTVKLDCSFENLYRKFNTDQMADFVIKTIVPKATRYAIGYHYFGYPLINTTSGETYEGLFAGYVPDSIFRPFFGASDPLAFNFPNDQKGTDLGGYELVAAKAGKNENQMDDYLNELFNYLGGHYEAKGFGLFSNSKADQISLQTNYDSSVWKQSPVPTQPLAWTNYKQPLNETYAKLWDPGASTAMKGSNVPTGKDLDGETFKTIDKTSALATLVGPFATTPWYFQYDGPEEQKSFANSNIVTAFQLAPALDQSAPESDALQYILAPNKTIDKVTPKVWDYIIDIQSRSVDTLLKGEYTQNLQGLKSSKPLEFKITSQNNSTAGTMDNTVPGGKMISMEDFNSLGYTNVLGGYGGNSPNADLNADKVANINGGIVGKKGNALTIIPKNKAALEKMLELTHIGRNEAFFIKENGSDGDINPTNTAIGDFGETELDTDKKNQLNRMWEAILAVDTDNWGKIKWLSDTFLMSLYKKIPYGLSVAEQYEIPVGANIPIEFGNGLEYSKDGVAVLGPVQPGPLGLASPSNLEAVSDFLFPVWDYSKDSLTKINYGRIINANDPGKLAGYADEIAENPEVLLQENVGTPEWVNSFQIYPSISPEYIGSGLALGLNGSDTTTDQIENNINSNLTEWKGYKSGFNWNGSAGLPWVGFAVDDDGVPLIELRYALELEIDETKLITDLVRQGVFTLAGDAQNYAEAGFDVDELLLATGGEVYNPSLENAYAGALSKQTGPDIDFSEFPFLITGETAAGQVLPSEIYLEAQKIADKNPNDKIPVTSVIFSSEDFKTVPFKVAPGPKAKNLGYLDNLTLVKVTKEWANGKGDYNEIEIVDLRSPHLGKKGYIEPKDLVDFGPPSAPVLDEMGKALVFTFEYPKFFNSQFKSKGYELAQTEILPMSEMAKALIPTWWKNEEPYYNREEGYYYYSVNMPYDCVVDDTDLESKKIEAVKKGLSELLDFYGRQYEISDIDTFAKTYLAASYEDFHIDLRPGSSLKMLIKVGGIYLNGFPTLQDQLNQLKQASDKLISLDAPFYPQHLEQAVFGMNKMYIDLFASPYQIQGFDLLKEAQRLSDVQTFIKKLIVLNGFDLAIPGDHVINLGFTSNYELLFISYKEQGSEEKLLTIGFNYFKARTPFIDKNTMALFYYHRRLRNPSLTFQKLVKEILPEPKPEIIAKENSGQFDYPSNKCSPPGFAYPPFSDIIDGLANQLDQALDLNPRFDLGAFEFSLRKFFPPCPKPAPGKGPTLFKTIVELDGERNLYENFDFLLNLTEERDRINDYVGDFLTSADALKDIKNKVIDLDDLHKYVTSMIDLPTLYSTICRCFLDLAGIDEVEVPNFEMKASGGSAGASLSPALQGKGKDEVLNLKGPEGSYSTDPITMDAGDLYCSFCLEVPELFLRLPTTNILQELLNALRKLLEFILSQLLLELIAALLEVLLTCPDIQCPEGQEIVKDYGGQDFNSIFDQSGVPTDEFFINCGVTGDALEIQNFLGDVSKRVSSGEVLDLIDGTPSIEVLQTIDKVLADYPNIKAQLKTKTQIEDFFTCAGRQLPFEIIDGIEKDITDKFKDPEVCKDLLQDAKKQLKEKCGTEDNSNKIAARATGADIDKYKKLADIIRKQSDLSTQLPPLFGDGKGNLGLMSGMNSPTMDHAVEQMVDSLMLPVEVSLATESREYTKGALKKGLVNPEPAIETLLSMPPITSIPIAIMMPDLKNKLVNDVDNIAFGELSQNTTIFTPLNRVIVTLDENNSVFLELKPPVSDSESGELIYTDNFNIGIKDERLGTINISPTSTGGITKEQQDILSQYPLFESDEYSEQSQYFSNLFLNGIGFGTKVEVNAENDAEFSSYGEATTGALKNWSAKSLYFSLFKALIRDLSENIADGELLKTYNVNIFDEIPSSVLTATIEKLSALFPLIDIEDFLPDVQRRELEQVDLTPANSSANSSTPQGLINFPLVKEIIKKNYDFSEFYDPNSKELGMPQYAILEGAVIAMVQLFVGEFFAKSIFVLSKIPINYFTDDYSLLDIVIKEVEIYLDQPGNAKFKSIFKETVLRLITRKSEWTFSDQNKTNFGDPGKVYDATLGKEMYIDTWQSATKYFMRQYYKAPIIFLKNRLNNTKLKENGVEIGGYKKIEQLNPLSALSYPNLLEIYSEDESSEIATSSICAAERINEFKDGKFFYQYYYEVIDWEPEDPFYNQSLVEYRQANGLQGPMSAKNLSDFFRNIYLNTDETFGVITKPDIILGTLIGTQIKDLFKDIRIGIRYNYGYSYTKDPVVNGNGELVPLEQNEILKEISQDITNLISGNAQEIDGFQGLGSAEVQLLQNKLQTEREKNKSIVMYELVDDDPETASRVSYIFPFFNKSASIKNWELGYAGPDLGDKVTFDKSLYEIAHGLNTNDALVTAGPLLDNFDDLINEERIKTISFDLLVDLISSDQFQILYKYCLSIPKILYILSIYNNLAVSSQSADGNRVNNAFLNTKNSIKETILNVYKYKGPEAYKQQPDAITQQGGASGIAKSAIKGAP